MRMGLKAITPMLAIGAAAVAIGAAPIAEADVPALPVTIDTGPTTETVAHGWQNGWHASDWHGHGSNPWSRPLGLPW